MTPEQQIRTLRTEAQTPGATDIKAMEARVIALDTLYELAGRNNPNSPSHGLFTGLWQPAPDNL